MRAVMISVRPQWCVKIKHKIGEWYDGAPIYEKTVEVRKSRPKIDIPFKCYIYETKAEYKSPDGYIYKGAGAVIGEFICDGIEEFTPTENGVKFKRFSALGNTCLSVNEIRAYLNGKVGYGWHISELAIYEKPLKIYEFRSAGTVLEYESLLTRPPQSWCYVKERIF